MTSINKCKGKIAIISHQFSIVVKSLEKGIVEMGYLVTLLEDDINTVNASFDRFDIYIVYLQDTVLGDMDRIQKLFLVCDTIQDQKKKLIFIGSEEARTLFVKNFPSISDILWFNRPVDMDCLKGELNKEMTRILNDSQKRRILIIDDDFFYAKTVAGWLEGKYHVEIVTDGMQAVRWLVKNTTDLILLDYEMPVIDGPKILEMFRTDPNSSSIPVIFLTGNGKKESIERVLSLKPQGYLLKTSPKRSLMDTIGAFFKGNAEQ